MARTNLIWIIALAGLGACNSTENKNSDADPASTEPTRTPVTTAPVVIEDLTDSIELNATSSFLQSSYVRSTATGYIRSVNTRPGEFVQLGKVLFTVQTKESMVIGNSISKLDSSFKFSGIGMVKAPLSGWVTQLNHQPGDYVQDGEQLAVISDMNSFAFLLNLPYELRPYVLNKKHVDLLLPDGVHLNGFIGQVMPVVDSASQTQPVVIKVDSRTPIPQNVIAKVRIAKEIRPHAQTLPKPAVLSDEAQTQFWVMRMIDSGTAVRTPVKKGVDLRDRVEILEPVFSKQDRIVVTGNYGLADTARVIDRKQ